MYCTVNMVCHSCCHHREFTSWRTHEHQCCYCGFEMTSQLLPLTLNERTSHRPSDDAICDLRHDLRRDLGESRWFSCVNTTWLGPGPSLKWDSVRVQVKSWVKSQVKTVSEYGPWSPNMHHSAVSTPRSIGTSPRGQITRHDPKNEHHIFPWFMTIFTNVRLWYYLLL